MARRRQFWQVVELVQWADRVLDSRTRACFNGGMTNTEQFSPAQEREAAAWEEAARATRMVEGGTDDPADAAKLAWAAANAWTLAATATDAVIREGVTT